MYRRALGAQTARRAGVREQATRTLLGEKGKAVAASGSVSCTLGCLCDACLVCVVSVMRKLVS